MARANQDPAIAVIADEANNPSDWARVSATPNHPRRDAPAAAVATNAMRVALTTAAELSVAEKTIAITSAPKNAPIAAQIRPTIRRTDIWMNASDMRGRS